MTCKEALNKAIHYADKSVIADTYEYAIVRATAAQAYATIALVLKQNEECVNKRSNERYMEEVKKLKERS